MKGKHTKVKIIFIVAIIVLIVLSFISFFRITNLIKNTESINHIQKVKLELNKTLSTLQYIETSQRGYMLTKDVSLLIPIKVASEKINSHLIIIKMLTKGNEIQQQNVKKLRVVIFKRLNFLNRRLFNVNSAEVFTQSWLIGKTLMDSVTVQITNMDREEDRYLKNKSISLNRLSIITPYTGILLILFSLLIISAAYYKIINELNKADNLKKNIELSKNELVITQETILKKNKELTKVNTLLFEQKELFETILNSSPDLIGAYDKDLRLIAFNKACEDLFQIKKEDILGKIFFEAFPVGLNSKEHLDLLKAINGEVVTNAKYGSVITGRYYKNIITPLKNATNDVYAVLAIAHDITDVVIASENYQKLNEELLKKNKELEITNKELESFNYISSHDLQEPLRQIQNFASRINSDENQNLSSKGKIYLNKMNNAAKRMQILISDLLAYSKTKTAERKFEFINLKNILDDVIVDFGDIIDEKQATIEFGEMCEASVIPFQFRQLMYNIIGNALKFSNPVIPPIITIKCLNIFYSHNKNENNTQKKYWHISITDNGIGFEPEYKERIFEVFQRLHDRAKIEGTGIGLAIVKKIMENHNGYITATSELNKGATFEIYLPILEIDTNT